MTNVIQLTNVIRLKPSGPENSLWSRRHVVPAVLHFPAVLHPTFAQEVRRNLACSGARSSAPPSKVYPLRFDKDGGGGETCRLANHLVIGRDANGALWVGDGCSGFVDHGPFGSVREICAMIAWLGA